MRRQLGDGLLADLLQDVRFLRVFLSRAITRNEDNILREDYKQRELVFRGILYYWGRLFKSRLA